MMPRQLRTSAMVVPLVARVIGLVMKGMLQVVFPMGVLILALCMVQMGVGATYSPVVKQLEEHATHSVMLNESGYAMEVPKQWKNTYKTVLNKPMYEMVDEFGRKATIPHEGGMLSIRTCTNPRHSNGTKWLSLSTTTISIPKQLDAITTGVPGQKEAWVRCKESATDLFLPTGSIPRVAGQGKCKEQRDKVTCGLKRYEAKRVCLKREPHKAIELQGECVNMYKNQLYDRLHLAYITETDCSFVEKFHYKINGKQDMDIIPGIVVGMEKEDTGMTVKAVEDASGKAVNMQCTITGAGEGGDMVEKAVPKSADNGASIDVQAIQALNSGRLARVDCRVEVGSASTYFLIGIKAVVVECPSDSGQPATCAVPHWMDVQGPIMANNPQKESGNHTCAVAVEQCFPKIDAVSVVATKKCPSTYPDATANLEGAGSKESGGQGGMIAGVVCAVIMLAILVAAMAFFIHKREKKRMEKVPEGRKRTPQIELPPIDDTASDASEWDLKREREPEDGPVEKEPLGPDDTLFDIPSLVRNHYEKERDVTSTSGVSQGRGQGPGGGQSQRGASMAQSLRSARGDPSTSMTEANKGHT